MMNRRNRLRRAALVLALLVLAAIVTGVAASATKTVVPKQLQRRWGGNGWAMQVYPSGYAEVWLRGVDDGNALFSHVTAHRLTIGETTVLSSSCSGPTGTYRWTITHRPSLEGSAAQAQEDPRRVQAERQPVHRHLVGAKLTVLPRIG
jgi:hypothetical protein